MKINLKKRVEIKNLIDLELIISFSIMFLCLLLYIFFPIKEGDNFQQFFVNLAFLFILPLLYIKVVLKGRMRNFGFQLVSWREGFWIVPACLAIFSLFVYGIFYHTDFKDNYLLGSFQFVNSFWYLFFYEFVIVNIFVLFYELFFRGFVMFYFAKKFGSLSILIQFFMFVLFFWMMGRISLDGIFYVLVAPLAGIIAYRSKSLAYSYFFSIIVLVAVDIIYLKLIK